MATSIQYANNASWVCLSGHILSSMIKLFM
uniref:Uncharacterized protein n=1 Tax=Anguilla anguilla TaxID=7936 RepID=A0A0E9RBT7_ANGAN